VDNPSRESVHKWINERQEKGEEMKGYENLEMHFPGGPGRPAEKQVDIVVVTTESA
jgi:hypothetical protein